VPTPVLITISNLVVVMMMMMMMMKMMKVMIRGTETLQHLQRC
jgi:hypothetical protein